MHVLPSEGSDPWHVDAVVPVGRHLAGGHQAIAFPLQVVPVGFDQLEELGIAFWTGELDDGAGIVPQAASLHEPVVLLQVDQLSHVDIRRKCVARLHVRHFRIELQNAALVGQGDPVMAVGNEVRSASFVHADWWKVVVWKGASERK